MKAERRQLASQGNPKPTALHSSALVAKGSEFEM